RPLSVAIPEQDSSSASGPYCPMRPRLADILANTAPPPWTLSAFMAYLSQNHCLETLEFTMDAGRYRKHYHKMLTRPPGGVIQPESHECEYLRMLWSRLLEAYIRPSGEREVNLPSDVRDDILNLPNHSIPPPPESLDLAVAKINELMEESVLYPFLNSFEEHTARLSSSSTSLSTYNNPSEENLTRSSTSTTHRFSSRRRTTPPPASA
ncbi:regulator of G protein signaling superfamily, partial [Viridothelium virens]